MVTIILTTSRVDYLEKVITSLELLECNNADTNILCIVDGDDKLYVKARNLINGTKFNQRLTVKTQSKDAAPRLDINQRRKRIAAAHNQARGLIAHNDGYVLSVEDDTIFNGSALRKLLDIAVSHRAFGMAEGVELGRWGVPYVGAWIADDIYNLKQLKSVENINPVPEGQQPTHIDAGGLYCALIRTDLYKMHEFNSANGLGPDVNLGIELRQAGFENFIAWDVPCTHLYNNMGQLAKLTPNNTSKVVTLTRQKDTKWSSTY